MRDHSQQTPPPGGSMGGAIAPLRDVLVHLTNLVQAEIDLARAEVRENLSRAGVAVGLLVGAVVLALSALNVLAASAVAALTATGMGAGWAAVLVGGILALIAGLLLSKGLRDLRASSLAPKRTLRNVNSDVAVIKETIHD